MILDKYFSLLSKGCSHSCSLFERCSSYPGMSLYGVKLLVQHVCDGFESEPVDCQGTQIALPHRVETYTDLSEKGHKTGSERIMLA